MALPTVTAKSQQRGLMSFSAIVNYLSKRFPTDDNITIVNNDMRYSKLTSSTATNYTRPPYTKALRRQLVYEGKVLKGHFVEEVDRSTG